MVGDGRIVEMVTSIDSNVNISSYVISNNTIGVATDSWGFVHPVHDEDRNETVPADPVTAEFYFSKVKGSMSKSEIEEMNERLEKLTKVLTDAARNGQRVLQQETQKEIAKLVLQQQAAAIDCDLFVSADIINEFRHQVEFRTPELVKLENFNRVIPKRAADKIKRIKGKKVFDEYVVLTWNPKEEQVKSVTDRIIQKDPICFGRFFVDPDRYYYIVDWIDELCDLTFSKMIDEVHKVRPEYEVEHVDPISTKDLERIVTMVKESNERLNNTNPRNWRGQAFREAFENEEWSWDTACSITKSMFKQAVNTIKSKFKKKLK